MMKLTQFLVIASICQTLIVRIVLAEISFVDVSEMAGVAGDVYHSSGGHGLGINWVDINNDGWEDLFVVGGQSGITSKLFINNRNGTFAAAHHLLPALPAVEMSGSRFADFDRDGDKDLFIYTDNPLFRPVQANLRDGPENLLLVNQLVETGKLSFNENAAAAGLSDLAPFPFGDLPAYRSKTASWFDYDRDGCIDLFVGHLVINSAGDEANKDRLYHNNCNGSFTDKTAASGINPGTDSNSYRAALVSGGFHLNADLWPDLYVANVSGLLQQPMLNDFLYINQGAQNGSISFIESISNHLGMGDDAQAAMGIDVADVNNDGAWDIYISDLFETTLDEAPLGNVLYLGGTGGNFTDNVALETGVQGLASWGVNFFDADHDGWEDLFVATIFANDPDLFYRNNGLDAQQNVTFNAVTQAAGISADSARGSAIADYDHDGDIDVALVNQAGTLQLYQNNSTNQGHWIVLVLQAKDSNLDAIGSIAKIQTPTGQQMRQVKGGNSSHSQDSVNIHFGLANHNIISELTVQWPSGQLTQLHDIPANQYLMVYEDDGVFSNGFE